MQNLGDKKQIIFYAGIALSIAFLLARYIPVSATSPFIDFLSDIYVYKWRTLRFIIFFFVLIPSFIYTLKNQKRNIYNYLGIVLLFVVLFFGFRFFQNHVNRSLIERNSNVVPGELISEKVIGSVPEVFNQEYLRQSRLIFVDPSRGLLGGKKWILFYEQGHGMEEYDSDDEGPRLNILYDMNWYSGYYWTD